MEVNTYPAHWVFVEQVAEHLNVKSDAVYKWLERNEMPAHEDGQSWRSRIPKMNEWGKSGVATGNIRGDA